jgi:hypothetical protein
MATMPAKRPLQIIVTSGFPKRSQTNTHAVRAPDADASIVFVAMTEMRTSELASGARIEAEPSKGEDERAGYDHWDVVGWDRVYLPIL